MQTRLYWELIPFTSRLISVGLYIYICVCVYVAADWVTLLTLPRKKKKINPQILLHSIHCNTFEGNMLFNQSFLF